MNGEIETLLKQANSIDDGTTSVNSARKSFPSAVESRAVFGEVRQNLFDIQKWSANSTSSSYALFDNKGAGKTGPIAEGDFIRITVHGSGKNDWVNVIRIVDTADELVITVSPSFDPTEKPPRTEVISHFFHDSARNNFCLQRIDKTIIIYVIGLNERQNVYKAGGLVESARNITTANAGYYLGIQNAVWNEFCTNFLEPARDDAD